MTATEMMQYVNKTGLIAMDGLKVEVSIIDARRSWGKLQYEITPVNGEGRKWVDAERVKLNA